MSEVQKDWARALGALRAELDEDLATAAGLKHLAAQEGALEAALADLDGQLQRVERAAVVVLVGPTGAGKSTLLNALVGQEIAREGVLRPTTSRPVIHAPPDADLGALLAELPGATPEVVRYTPTATGPFAGQVLVDAPDVNSVERAHRAMVAALAERADVLVGVLKADSVVEEATVSFLEGFCDRRALVLVLGRADELSAAAQREVIDQIRALAQAQLGLADPQVLPISASDARAGRGGAPFAALVAEIQRLAEGSALGQVRRHNALGSVAALATTLRPAQAAGIALEQAVAQQGAALDALAAATGEEVARRMALRRTELTEHLASEVGRGWSGPTGWTLRAGRLPIVGLGGAALLARRSLRLAAGAAVAGAVAGRVQEHLAHRRLHDTAELLPSPAKLDEDWHRLGLESGLALGALLRPERQPELVPGEALHGRFLRAVAERWSTLTARDLRQAAAHLSRPITRLGLDLLPLALLGWMGWRAAHGFVMGRYLGLDFLINGLFLLATLLLLLRLGIGSWLDRTSGRLLATAGQEAAAGIAKVARAASERPRQVAREIREATDRLATLDARWRARLQAPAEAALTLEPAAGPEEARQRRPAPRRARVESRRGALQEEGR